MSGGEEDNGRPVPANKKERKSEKIKLSGSFLRYRRFIEEDRPIVDREHWFRLAMIRLVFVELRDDPRAKNLPPHFLMEIAQRIVLKPQDEKDEKVRRQATKKVFACLNEFRRAGIIPIPLEPREKVE